MRGIAVALGGMIARKVMIPYPQNGAITIQDGLHELTKAGVGAYTLAAPTAAIVGTQLIITSTTANAHVVTATGLLDNGVAGGSKTTATFAAFPGATITLIATDDLKWKVQSSNAVTVA